jgi:predicted RNA polymerase sigma factor
MVRDVGLAENLAQDALVIALQRWPEAGVPENPGAWLMATAKRRAIDLLRRRKSLAGKYAELGRQLEVQAEPEPATTVGDDLLVLIFAASHPVLPREGRVALTLRLLGGLTTEEIARAFLVPEPAARLASVLEVIYLVFNEGYAATGGSDWIRPPLCQEALWLGRILAELAPAEAEVHGLVALMEIQASRFKARTGPAGEPVLLLEQNRAFWDHHPSGPCGARAG